MAFLRSYIKQILPKSTLDAWRLRKQKKRRLALNKQRDKGAAWTKQALFQQLVQMNIQKGDTLLVHSSLSNIGYVEGGAETVISALLEAIGPEGNLLMPSSPNAALQLDYMLANPIFDVLQTPSRMGAMSEVFRKMPSVKRSLHPTEPVCSLGPDADWLTSGHLGQITPYSIDSPFARLYQKHGKILYIGVTLNNAGTNLHTLEDAVDFPYPIYYHENFQSVVIDEYGVQHTVTTKVHNPEWSKKRRCDELLPMFKHKGAAKDVLFGSASTLLFDGQKMFDVMKDQFNEKGITMYHPKGNIK